jgi:DNA (cytosine-5)-methyltransferase 1
VNSVGDKYNCNQLENPFNTIVTNPKQNLVTVLLKDKSSVILRKIGNLYVSSNIVDIRMRMLKIPELLQAQGFPKDYILKGNVKTRKKHIGNAVVPLMAKLLVEANLKGLEIYYGR